MASSPSGSSVAKSALVQKRVIAAGRALRTNQSAVFYAFYARGKVPRTYSPEYSYTILKGYHDQVRVLLTEVSSDAEEQFDELRAEQVGHRVRHLTSTSAATVPNRPGGRCGGPDSLDDDSSERP